MTLKFLLKSTQLLVFVFNIKDRDGKKTAVKIGKPGTDEPNTDLLVEERIIDVTIDFMAVL